MDSALTELLLFEWYLRDEARVGRDGELYNRYVEPTLFDSFGRSALEWTYSVIVSFVLS
jgi:hypothetical protein